MRLLPLKQSVLGERGKALAAADMPTAQAKSKKKKKMYLWHVMMNVIFKLTSSSLRQLAQTSGTTEDLQSPGMLHTNVAELRLLFDTFTRVWSSGGQANLSLKTKDSQVWAKLDLHLGPADGHRPGLPEAGGSPGAEPMNNQEQLRCDPHLHPQAQRRGPAARARDACRRQYWL